MGIRKVLSLLPLRMRKDLFYNKESMCETDQDAKEDFS